MKLLISFVIILLVGMAISIPMLNDTMFSICMGLIGLDVLSIISNQILLYRKILLDKFVYVLIIHALIECSIFVLLLTQVHWIWSVGVTLVMLPLIQYTYVICNKSYRERFNETVIETSSITYERLNKYGRWIKHNILRQPIILPTLSEFETPSGVKPYIKSERNDPHCRSNIINSELKCTPVSANDITIMTTNINKVIQGETVSLYREKNSDNPQSHSKYCSIKRLQNGTSMYVTTSYGNQNTYVPLITNTKHCHDIDEMKSHVKQTLLNNIKDGYSLKRIIKLDTLN